MLTTPLLLNLGCGERTHPLWINIDHSRKIAFQQLWFVKPFLRTSLPANYLNHDLRQGIPFQAGSADAAYSSHVLEHLVHCHAPGFLKELLRVLKPGGVIRLAVPDLEFAARNYLRTLEAVRGSADCTLDKLRHEWATIYLLDQMVRTECGGEMAGWLRSHRDSPVVAEMAGILRAIAADNGHQGKLKRVLLAALAALGMRNPARTGELHRWMYDDVSLTALLRSAGFREIQRVRHLESRIPGWTSYGLDNNPDDSPHQPGSVWMEAIK